MLGVGDDYDTLFGDDDPEYIDTKFSNQQIQVDNSVEPLRYRAAQSRYSRAARSEPLIVCRVTLRFNTQIQIFSAVIVSSKLFIK